MKVQLEKAFPLAGPAAAAWTLLQDVRAVAACMPGATLTERVDDSHYKGTIVVKMGPASLSFRGALEVAEVDPAARSLRLVGHGTDTTGTSGASMDLHARVETVDAASCRLLGVSEISVNGKAAAFGGRLMLNVADQVLKQFAANFSDALATVRAVPEAGAGDARVEPGATLRPPPPPLNALSLAWAAVRDWFAHLFAARRA